MGIRNERPLSMEAFSVVRSRFRIAHDSIRAGAGGRMVTRESILYVEQAVEVCERRGR